MPTSNPKIITPIIEYISKNAPESVLDVGIGFGKWGALIREYTDVLNYRFFKDEWIVLIHGIEIFEKYKNPNWNHYNQIFIDDACEIMHHVNPFYELIIFTDCIEHIEKSKALALLSELAKKTPTLIVSYCNDHQDAIKGNEHEEHISKWEVSDFAQYGVLNVLYEENNQAVICVSTSLKAR